MSMRNPGRPEVGGRPGYTFPQRTRGQALHRMTCMQMTLTIQILALIMGAFGLLLSDGLFAYLPALDFDAALI